MKNAPSDIPAPRVSPGLVTSGGAPRGRRGLARLFGGLIPILRKESIHIRRDPMALFMTILIPILQMNLLGFAINTNVRNIPTVVYDAARTQESRRLLERYVNSGDFHIIRYVDADDELNQAIRRGEARVGIKIPPDYSRRILAGNTASALVLVDGSDSMVAGEASNVANAIALQESLDRVLQQSNGRLSLPVEARRKILFNPDSRSPNYFLPGLIVILLQIITVTLTAFSIVREREYGTLEQLFMTPVTPLGLMIGKIIPYVAVAFTELCVVLALMVFLFNVPIHGSTLLLFALSLPFVLSMLGLGLLISTRAHSQQEAMQMAFGTMLPTIFLSGYIFQIENMPVFFQWISCAIPATWLIEIMRGIVLRGAGLADLWKPTIILCVMCVFMIIVSAARFRKKIG
ncbi:MAG: ABC transporter permease [Blastocatellia bacterium]